MVQNMKLDGSVEEVPPDEAKVAVHGAASATKEGP